jgi:hypothetical protein
MANTSMTLKPIQSIVRGDRVLVSRKPKTDTVQEVEWSVMKVSRLLVQSIRPDQLISIVLLKKKCLGDNRPIIDTYITENHPILYKHKRVPARYFNEMSGVVFYQNVRAGDYLPIDEDQMIRLYDLQFDDDEFYQINNLVIQSRSPRSIHSPLPKEGYYDYELYTDEVVWDTYDNPIPLDHQLR